MAVKLSWEGRPLTTQEGVLAELRRRLLSGWLRPGSPIRPDAIAADLNVSRAPVREALKILEGEGQIEYRPHRGYSVTELHFHDLVEIYRIRELLEEEAARCAVQKLDDESLERMRAAMSDMEALQDSDVTQLATANRRFHFALIEAADMQHLQHHIGLLWNSTDRYRSLYYMDRANLALVRKEHRQIFRAAKGGDIDSLLSVLAAHRQHAVECLGTVLSDG